MPACYADPPADTAVERQPSRPNDEKPECPFFARRIAFGALIDNRGSNQCALITAAFDPCSMEMHSGVAPDWRQCARNPVNNGGYIVSLSPSAEKRR